MSPFRVPFALLGFLGIVAVVPVWMWFLTSHPAASALTVQDQFLATMVLPVLAALFIASWIEPGL